MLAAVDARKRPHAYEMFKPLSAQNHTSDALYVIGKPLRSFNLDKLFSTPNLARAASRSGPRNGGHLVPLLWGQAIARFPPWFEAQRARCVHLMETLIILSFTPARSSAGFSGPALPVKRCHPPNSLCKLEPFPPLNSLRVNFEYSNQYATRENGEIA